MECNLGNTMASSLQSWDQLKDRRSKDNKMFREIWKAVETEARKIGVVKAKERREKETRRKEKEKDNGCEESNRRMGNLGQRRESSKVGGRSQEVSPSKVP